MDEHRFDDDGGFHPAEFDEPELDDIDVPPLVYCPHCGEPIDEDIDAEA